jgi:hypothetical protein
MRKLSIAAAVAVLALSLASFAKSPWHLAPPDTSLDSLSFDELPLAAPMP